MSEQLLVATTYGAFLVGGSVAFALSGIVNVQTYIYFKLYPKDERGLKSLVAIIWITDLLHSGFIMAGLWRNVITQYGNADAIDSIPWPVALTVTCTAVITFLVHCFFANRIYRFSHHNWWIVGPIMFFNFVRFGSAIGTTVEMLHYGRFTLFKKHVRWLATLGLSLSSSVDIIVTLSLWYYLRKSKSKSMTLNRVIDTLLIYAFETGTITCATTTITMICWVTMPQNLVFMGFHFLIAKCFANSLLVTLNARLQLRLTGMISSVPATSLQFDHHIKGLVNTKTTTTTTTTTTQGTTIPSVSSKIKPPMSPLKPSAELELPEDVQLMGFPSPRPPRTHSNVIDIT